MDVTTRGPCEAINAGFSIANDDCKIVNNNNVSPTSSPTQAPTTSPPTTITPTSAPSMVQTSTPTCLYDECENNCDTGATLMETYCMNNSEEYILEGGQYSCYDNYGPLTAEGDIEVLELCCLEESEAYYTSCDERCDTECGGL